MAELGPLFGFPLTRVERMREAARVDSALIGVKVVGDIVGSQRLLAIADTRVCQPTTAGIWEDAFERTRERRVDCGGFPDEKNPAVMLPAVVCIWMRDGDTDFFGSWGVRTMRWLATSKEDALSVDR